MRLFKWVFRAPISILARAQTWLDWLSGRPKSRRQGSLVWAEGLEARHLLSAIFANCPLDGEDPDAAPCRDEIANPSDGIPTTHDNSAPLNSTPLRNSVELRNAVDEANSIPGADSIALSDGVFTIDNGALWILDDVSIRGDGPDKTTIDATEVDRLFELSLEAQLDLADLTIRVNDLKQIASQTETLSPLDNVAIVLAEAASEASHSTTLESAGVQSNDHSESAGLNSDSITQGADRDRNADPPIPSRQLEPLGSNSRQLNLLTELAQSRWNSPSSMAPWIDFVRQPDSNFQNNSRPDAINQSTIERLPVEVSQKSGDSRQPAASSLPPASPMTLTAKPQVKKARPNWTTTAKSSPSSKSTPADARRRDVVNSLFENKPGSKSQVRPAGAEQPSESTPFVFPKVAKPSPALIPNPYDAEERSGQESRDAQGEWRLPKRRPTTPAPNSDSRNQEGAISGLRVALLVALFPTVSAAKRERRDSKRFDELTTSNDRN